VPFAPCRQDLEKELRRIERFSRRQLSTPEELKRAHDIKRELAKRDFELEEGRREAAARLAKAGRG
jgi:hypothetical protein